ncbi:MAG: hypothetical protein VX246_10900 [Myxococcota bacterium]|nr:hypothetical protein [Myxococcota bacterium]
MNESLDTPAPIATTELQQGHHWLARIKQNLGKQRTRMFRYEQPDTAQTLREGLEEYYSHDPSLLSPGDVSSDIALGLRAHDASHVVFGCDTLIRGEVTLARWSLFGARGAMTIYFRGLRSAETRFLFTDFIRKVRPVVLCLSAIDSVRAVIRSLRMHKRWPALDWEQYVDRPLVEIRREFGIRVV